MDPNTDRESKDPTDAVARIGLIGCGRRLRGLAGRLHDKAGPAAKFVSAFDPRPGAVESASAQVNTPLHRHDSPQALCADPAIDWVMIGSPNASHSGHAVMALESGKHVFCEKPLATTLDDCLAVAEAVKRTGKHFSFGLTLRYAPFYRRIRTLLEEGAIGDLVSFEFNEALAPDHGGFIHRDWRRHRAIAGSHVLEKCCHDIDIAQWLAGGNPLKVASFGGRSIFTAANAGLQDRVKPHANGRRAFEAWDCDYSDSPFNDDKDIVDHQVAILAFDNGVKATFHTNCCAAIPERRVYLLGTEGVIRGDVLAGRVEHRRIGPDQPTVAYEYAGGGHGGGDAVLIEALLATMHEDAEPAAGIAQALASAVVCFGIDEALDTGSTVDLAPRWNAIQGHIHVP